MSNSETNQTSGFLTVNSNTKKHQFMTRSGSYSTHGNAKGFVDEYFSLPENQLNNIFERREVLRSKKFALTTTLQQIREELEINPKKSMRIYESSARKGMFRGSHKQSQKLIEAISIAEDVRKIQDELHEIKGKIQGIECDDIPNMMLNFFRNEYPALFDEALVYTKELLFELEIKEDISND